MPFLFEKDIQRMMTKFMTFDEVIDCANKDIFDFLAKNRIKRFKEEVFGQLNVAFGFVTSLAGGKS
jgi:hypothetical protein